MLINVINGRSTDDDDDGDYDDCDDDYICGFCYVIVKQCSFKEIQLTFDIITI